MSNRAPNRELSPLRRAAQPSKPSSARATEAVTTAAQPAGGASGPVSSSPASRQVSTARASVMALASPSRRCGA